MSHTVTANLSRPIQPSYLRQNAPHSSNGNGPCNRTGAMRRSEAGVTLIELVIVVAIIGILAAVAVFMFGKSTDKAKASEVPAMFAELKIKQERYFNENGEYLSTGTDESDTWPASPAGDKKPNSLTPMPSTWSDLRLTPDKDSVYCSYVAIAGDADDDTNVGAVATQFGFSAPGANWYYLVAECDWDNKPSTNSLYFTSSNTQEIFKQNEGR